MRAVVYTESGPSSVLNLVERPDPEPGPGEVAVQVHRSGVNPTDWKFRANRVPAYPEIAPGHDGAGIVTAVGEGVTRVSPGDRVWLFFAQSERAYGTGAEITVQPQERVLPLPESASFDLGAALGVPFVTAHRLLTSGDTDRLAPGALAGQTVLVAGGAGAVGNAAIQLARWAGAEIITTVSSPEKATLATAAGAHHVVNYRTGDAQAEIRALAPNGVDLVVEVAPGPNAALDLAVTRVHATIAIYANDGGDALTIPVAEAYFKNLRYQFVVLYTIAPDLVAAALEDLGAALRDGAVRVGEDAGLPLHHYPLEEYAAAHDAVEAGTVGKVIVDLA